MLAKTALYRSLIIILFIFGNSSSALGEVVFEGYYKVILQDTHIGFFILKTEFDSKKKQWKITQYLTTNDLGNNITESLQAVSNEGFDPVSYKYTSKVGKGKKAKLKTIDATVKGNVLSKIVGDGKGRTRATKKLPKGAFLSAFLPYLMLANGVKVDTNMNYYAIAEEDGEVFSGSALVQKRITVAGIPAFRVINTFKSSKFISLMTDKGEALQVDSPLQGLKSRLVPTPRHATKGLRMDGKALKLLFGKVPRGRTNIMTQQMNSAKKAGG